MTARFKAVLVAVVLVVWNSFPLNVWCQMQAPDAPKLRLTAETTTLSLAQAIDAAIKSNVAMRNGVLEIAISKDRVVATRSHALPVVRLNAVGAQLISPLNFRVNKGALGTDGPVEPEGAPAGFAAPSIDNGPIPRKDTNIGAGMNPILLVNAGLLQPISQLPTIALRTKQAKIATETAREKLRSQRQQIVNQVRHTYYKALELQDALPVLDATSVLFREIARTTEEHLKYKAVMPADSIEVKQQLARLEYDDLQTRDNLAATKEELNRLMGRDARVDFTLVDVGAEAPVAEVDLQTAQNRALQLRSDLKQANTQAKQLALEEKIKRLAYLPDVSVMIDYFSIFGAQEILPKNVVFAALVASWEPIDWGRRRAEINEQKRLKQQALNVVSDVESQSIIEVNASYRKLQESKMQLHVAEIGQQLANERLRVLANKYKERASLLRDVLQAQKDLAQADDQYAQATLALWAARADLERAMGED